MIVVDLVGLEGWRWERNGKVVGNKRLFCRCISAVE